MKRNKICYVLPQYFKNSAENFYHISNFLSELGKLNDVFLIIENSDIIPGKIPNIKATHIINPGKKSNLFHRTYKLIELFIKFQKNGVNIFFIRASLTGSLPIVIYKKFNKSKNVRTIFWSCGQDVVPLSFLPTKKNLKRLTSKFLAKLVFKHTDFVATGPSLMVDYYANFYSIPKSKIIELHNDISLNRFCEIDSKAKKVFKNKLDIANSKIILFVHTFNLARGIDLVPKIALKIKEKKLNIKILCIGRPGDFSKELEKEIIKHCLSDIVVNIGQVPNRIIQQYYQVSDLFIMPSRGEGFPRVILESMACGCPVLTFDVGGIRGILPKGVHNDFVVSIKNEYKFIEKSIELINSDKKLNDCKKAILDHVDNFETKLIAKKYTEAFSKL